MIASYFLITITEQYRQKEALRFFSDHGISPVFCTVARGTAQREILDTLGLEVTEKSIFFSLINENEKRPLFRSFVKEFKIDLPGNGISLTVPVSSIGGTRSADALFGKRSPLKEPGPNETKGETKLNAFTLIVCITENGFTDLVMDGARAAGATGGTVVHAKGTASGMASFFGIPIGSEKEMIFIVAKESDRVAIMRSVSEKAGHDTQAKTSVFSLPVESIIGLRKLTEESEEDA